MPIPNEQKMIPIAVAVRNHLLQKNLLLSESVIKYATGANIANLFNKPANVYQNEFSGVIDSTDILDDGPLYLDSITLLNKYKSNNDYELYSTSFNNSSYYQNLSNNEYNPTSNGISPLKSGVQGLLLKSENVMTQTINKNQYDNLDKTYVNEKGKLSGFKFETASNVIGSILNGNGVGFSSDGIEPNFDIRSSLGGRILGATGIIDDTPLGKYAVVGLKNAVLNNIAYHTQKETLGKINTNVLEFASNGYNINNVIVPNNDITVPESGFNKVSDIVQKITGFEFPKSNLPTDYSFYTFKDDFTPYLVTSNNPTYDLNANQILINNTGQGHQRALFRNLNANILNNGNGARAGYSPAYLNSKDSKNGVENPFSYNTNINDYDSLKYLNTRNFNNSIDFSWPDDNINPVILNNGETILKNDNSLLSKTAKLFKDDKINTMIKLTYQSVDNNMSEVQSSVIENVKGSNYVISKGNAVVNKERDGFCRTWTSEKRYGVNYNTLQKHSGLNKKTSNGFIRLNVDKSVLDKNGFVRIAPTTGDGGDTSMKRFMFSLENLAWVGEKNLRDCEKGPNNGRIMWFPPYNLSFNDSSSVNWETNEFIGRGEPVYTYNNTERSGTLSFKIIIDHSNEYNDFKGRNIDDINRFIFGCDDLPESVRSKITNDEKNELDVQKALIFKPKTVSNNVTVVPPQIDFYFLNDVTEINTVYEDGDTGHTIGKYNGESSTMVFENKVNTGLNVDFNTRISDFIKFVNENKTYKIVIDGYATSQGSDMPKKINNTNLATNRANKTKEYLKTTYNLSDNVFSKVGISSNAIQTVSENESVDSDLAKSGRKVSIYLKNEVEKSDELKPTNTINKNENNEPKISSESLNGFLCENTYFEYINDKAPLSYNSLKESLTSIIPYFQPAFHSITPEGFNSRLTFLLQCSRQGPTINNNDKTTPDNLAFGKPPVCVLRIGDFYHSKIIINSVDLDFSEVQWDLNPEGIGVQPMIVDVNLSFKFIGGSSLEGPIARLQNAVSFNFFANSELYDSRSETYDKLKNSGTNSNNSDVVDVINSTSIDVNQVGENNEELSKTETNDNISETDDDKLRRLTPIVSSTYYDINDKKLNITLQSGKNPNSLQGYHDVFDSNHTGIIYIMDNKNNTIILKNNSINSNANFVLDNTKIRHEYSFFNLDLVESIYTIKIKWVNSDVENNFNLIMK